MGKRLPQWKRQRSPRICEICDEWYKPTNKKGTMCEDCKEKKRLNRLKK